MTVHPLSSESPRCLQPSKVTDLDLFLKRVEEVPFSASELQVHHVFLPWERQTFCKTAPCNKLRCILTASSLRGGHNPRNPTR